MGTILDIKRLAVEFHTNDGLVKALNGVDLKLEEGTTLGLVGETGAGKTTLSKAVMRLIQCPPGKIVSGEILYEGRDLLKLPKEDMQKICGKQISMIFQDPMTALNPVMTVGEQIAEAVRVHERLSRTDAVRRACEMMELVGLPAERLDDYPHQFSGGMKQRVVIAMALVCDPMLLLADEPTTALDVTVQNQVLDMMSNLKEELNTSMIMITHDLGIVCQMCDNVAIMYAGEIIEIGSVYDIFDFEKPHHPYTKGLFGSLPSLQGSSNRLKPVDGLMPDPMDLPGGCKFHPRCKHCEEICKSKAPEVFTEGSHSIRCHLYEKLKAGEI